MIFCKSKHKKWFKLLNDTSDNDNATKALKFFAQNAGGLSIEEQREIENLGSGKTNNDSEVHQNIRTTNEAIESIANN